MNQVSRNVALWLVLGLMVLLLFNVLNRQESRDPEIIFSEFLNEVRHTLGEITANPARYGFADDDVREGLLNRLRAEE